MTSTTKFNVKSLAIGLLACAAVAGAQAQSQGAALAMSPALSGVYVGGNLTSTTITDLGSKVGFGGFVGFKVNESIAIEGGVQSLGKYTVGNTSVSSSAYNISVLGMLPLDPKFSIYGRLGYGSLTSPVNGVSADTSSVLFGIGAKYNINPNLAVRGEYTRLASEVGTFGVGVQYGF